MMRRRLKQLIPIVLFAIVLQLLAPIAAFRVVAYAVNDPLAMATICSGMASSADDHKPPAKSPHQHGDCCGLCASGYGVVAIVDPPPLVFVFLQRHYQKISWLEAADPTAPVRVGSNTQARAPPQLM